MNYKEILETIRPKEEYANNLTTSERQKQNKERRIDSLLNVGYITPDEAKGYREQLAELPHDRKGLVVAYYLADEADSYNTPPTIETAERINEAVDSFDLRERYALCGKGIADSMTEEQQNKWKREIVAIFTSEYIKRAETFVDSKRRRIKGILMSFFPMEIALSLSEPKPENGMDSIPYLRGVLQANGYTGKDETLSDGDKAALQAAARHYLDMIELAFLSGIGSLRYEEYKDYRNESETEWTKTLTYRDPFDEVLTEQELTYFLFDTATSHFYNDSTPKEAVSYLTQFRGELFGGEIKYRYEPLKGGKFSYLLEEEATKC